MARRLAQATPAEQKAENFQLGLQLKCTRKVKVKEGEDKPPVKTQVKVWFCPTAVAQVDVGICPPEEAWAKFPSKDGTPYDPTQAVESELLECLLKHGLPKCSLVQALPPTRKRKRNTDVQYDTQEREDAQLSSSQRKKPAQNKQNATTKTRARPRKDLESGEGRGKSSSKARHKEPAPRSPTPPPPTFHLPEGLAELKARAQVIDLCEGEESSASEMYDSEDDPELAHAIRLSLIDRPIPSGSMQNTQSGSRRPTNGSAIAQQEMNMHRSSPTILDSPSIARHGPLIQSWTQSPWHLHSLLSKPLQPP